MKWSLVINHFPSLHISMKISHFKFISAPKQQTAFGDVMDAANIIMLIKCIPPTLPATMSSAGRATTTEKAKKRKLPELHEAFSQSFKQQMKPPRFYLLHGAAAAAT